MKVLQLIDSLNAGGAERVMSFVSQQLNSNDFDVKLVVAIYIIILFHMRISS